MAAKKKIVVSLILGAVFSGIALYFAFKNIPLNQLFDYLTTVNYWWAVPSVAVTLTAFVVRVFRWQLLLNPVKQCGFRRAFHPMMIGFAMNCLLPARLGEVARPAIFSKKEKVPFFKVLATVGVERVFDLLVLLIFFVVIMASVHIDPDLEISFGQYRLNKATLEKIAVASTRLAFALIVGIGVVSFSKSRNVMKRMIMAMPKLLFFFGPGLKEKIREKVCKTLVEILDNIAAGFDLIKNPRKLILCFLLSFLVWLLSAVAYYVFSFGSPGVNATFLEISAAMVIICFFISLPSVPGFWGLWEAGGVFALLVFGVPAKEAAGFTLANHVIQLVPVIVVGLISAVITGVHFMQVVEEKDI